MSHNILTQKVKKLLLSVASYSAVSKINHMVYQELFSLEFVSVCHTSSEDCQNNSLIGPQRKKRTFGHVPYKDSNQPDH